MTEKRVVLRHFEPPRFKVKGYGMKTVLSYFVRLPVDMRSGAKQEQDLDVCETRSRDETSGARFPFSSDPITLRSISFVFPLLHSNHP